MDNIQTKQEEIKTLMAELEGMDQLAPEFGEKLAVVKAAQLDLETIKQNADDFAAMQASLSSFKKPTTVQAGPVLGSKSIVGFGPAADPKKGFANSGELLSAIAKCTQGKALNVMADDRLAHLQDISQTSGQHNTTNDGLMIPTELDPTINTLGLDASDDWFSRIQVSQTSSNSKEIRRDAANTRGGSVGLVAGRIAELAAMTSSRQVYAKDTVGVDKIYVYSEVSEEDLDDFAFLESNLVSVAPEVMRIKKGEEVIFGDGNSKALGFTQGADLATVTRNAAGFIKAEDVVNMKARHLRTRGVMGSFWLVNQAVWSQLPLMIIGDQPVFVNDLSGTTDGFLLGMPVFTTEDCEALGAIGDIYLVNPSAYMALEKVGGDKFASSMHVKFDQDAMAFRWTSRFGGIPKFNAPYTPRDKNATTKDTLSNFVRLSVS